MSHDRAFDKERGFSRLPRISSENGDAVGGLSLVVLNAAVPSTCQGCGFGLCCGCWAAERLLGGATITRWMIPSGWGGSSMASEPLAAAGWVKGDSGRAGSGSDNPLRVSGWCLHGIGEAFHSLTEIVPGKNPANVRTRSSGRFLVGSTADVPCPLITLGTKYCSNHAQISKAK